MRIKKEMSRRKRKRKMINPGMLQMSDSKGKDSDKIQRWKRKER